MADFEPLTKKVELLRALERTKKQFDELIDIGDSSGFSEEDKELMESFKRINHTGLKQLEKFINELVEKGPKVDPYTILYYVRQLLGGPLAADASKLAQGKPYFIPSPNIMGSNGNLGRSCSSTPIHRGVQLGTAVDVFNKMPAWMSDMHNEIVQTSSAVFNSAIQSGVNIDNTLPYIDKSPAARMSGEFGDGYNTKPHGCYQVKDVEFQRVVESISGDIFKKVEDHLGPEDWRMFKFKKGLNLFDETKNVAKTFNAEVKRKMQFMTQKFDEEGVESIGLSDAVIKTDLQGNVFESPERKGFELKIKDGGGSNKEEKTFKLYTVKGQLGFGEKPTEDELTCQG